MPIGYGTYSSGPRSNCNFGMIGVTPTTTGRASGLFSGDTSYRSPRIPNSSLANASTAAVIGSPATSSPDPQVGLIVIVSYAKVLGHTISIYYCQVRCLQH